MCVQGHSGLYRKSKPAGLQGKTLSKKKDRKREDREKLKRKESRTFIPLSTLGISNVKNKKWGEEEGRRKEEVEERNEGRKEDRGRGKGRERGRRNRDSLSSSCPGPHCLSC